VLFVIGVIGGVFTFKSVLNADAKTETKEKVITENFNAIDINAEDIVVNVKPRNDSETTIELKTQTSEYDLTTDVKSDTLKVNVKHERKKLFNFNFFDFTPKIYVTVPEEEYEKIAVTTDNGVIALRNMTSDDVNVT